MARPTSLRNTVLVVGITSALAVLLVGWRLTESSPEPSSDASSRELQAAKVHEDETVGHDHGDHAHGDHAHGDPDHGFHGDGSPTASDDSTQGRPPVAVDLPDENPLVLPGAETTYVVAANKVQADLYGLPAEHVRSWGMRLNRSEDAAGDHRLLLRGLADSGFTVVFDTFTIDPAEPLNHISGRFGELMFFLVVDDRGELTLTVYVPHR